MNSKRRYKICICSVILGKLEVFWNYKGFSVIFLNILDATEQLTKYRRHFYELGRLQKIVGIFFSKIVPEWNTYLEIFSRILVIEIPGSICFSEQIFYRKQSLGAPDKRRPILDNGHVVKIADPYSEWN